MRPAFRCGVLAFALAVLAGCGQREDGGAGQAPAALAKPSASAAAEPAVARLGALQVAPDELKALLAEVPGVRQVQELQMLPGIVLPTRTGDWVSLAYMAVVVGAAGLLGLSAGALVTEDPVDVAGDPFVDETGDYAGDDASVTAALEEVLARLNTHVRNARAARRVGT